MDERKEAGRSSKWMKVYAQMTTYFIYHRPLHVDLFRSHSFRSSVKMSDDRLILKIESTADCSGLLARSHNTF